MTAYWLFTGKLPADPTDVPVLAGHGIPDRIGSALARGLSRDPERRFPSLHDLVLEFERELALDPEQDKEVAGRQWVNVFSIGLFTAAVMISLVFTLGRELIGTAQGALVAIVPPSLVILGAISQWRAISKNRFNRRYAAYLLLVVVSLVAHRAQGVLAGASAAAVFADDLFVLAALHSAAAVLLDRHLGVAAGICAIACVTATRVPSLAVPCFALSMVGSFAVGYFAFRRRVQQALC